MNEHLIIPSIEPIAAGQSRRLAASIAAASKAADVLNSAAGTGGGAPESRFSHEDWMPTHLKRVIVHIGFSDMPFRPRQTTTNAEIGEALRQWHRVTEATWAEKSFDRRDS